MIIIKLVYVVVIIFLNYTETSFFGFVFPRTELSHFH